MIIANAPHYRLAGRTRVVLAHGQFELRWWDDAPAGSMEHDFHDYAETLAFFRTYVATAELRASLRRMLADEDRSTIITLHDDDALLAEGAACVFRRRMRVLEAFPIPKPSKAAEREVTPERPASSHARRPPPSTAATAADEPTFAPDTEPDVMAKALQQAAETGVPFCEECLRG